MLKTVRKCFAKASFLVVLISLFLFPLVQAASAEEVLGESTAFSESQMTLLKVKPAVVQVTNVVSGEVVLQAVLAAEIGTPSLAGRTYSFAFGMSGSGFFLTEDGYLITNGHVANPDDDTIAYYAIANTAEWIFKDAVALIVEDMYDYTPTDEELDDAFQQQLQEEYNGDIWLLIDEFYQGYKSGEMDIDNVDKSNYIQTGSVSGTEKTVEELGTSATVVDSPYEGKSNSTDLALLKVEGSNYPSIELGSFENVQIGTDVYAIGYPAVVEEYTGIFTDEESGLEPSITKGIISAKKKLVDGTEAFQTDAAITHGNSGGPALNTDGEVIGVTTWGFGDTAGGEGFNFLISVEEIEKLLSQNNVTPEESRTTQKWETGLQYYSDKCYTKAKTEFEEVDNLYAGNVDIDDFITKCQEGIEDGKDECQSSSSTVIWIVVGGGCLCLLVVAGIVGVVLLTKKKKASGTKTINTEPTKTEPKK